MSATTTTKGTVPLAQHANGKIISAKIVLPGLGHTVSKHELQGIPKQVRSLMGEKMGQKDMHLVTEWENISMQ